MEANYWQHREYDFDQSDRPTIYPHATYGKLVYPSAYTDSQDWACVCPKYLAEQEHKSRNPLFAVTWMQGGKRVVTGSSSGELIIWYAPNYEYEKTTSVHKDRVQSIAWTNYEKFIISGDKKGYIIYSDNKIS